MSIACAPEDRQLTVLEAAAPVDYTGRFPSTDQRFTRGVQHHGPQSREVPQPDTDQSQDSYSGQGAEEGGGTSQMSWQSQSSDGQGQGETSSGDRASTRMAGLKAQIAREGQLRELLMLGPAAKAFSDSNSIAGPRPKTSVQSPADLGPGSQYSVGSQPPPPAPATPGVLPQGAIKHVVAADGTIRPKKVRHKKRVNGKKICLVCGDKALAHNFDVITCESCKAFFRRNAQKSQSLQRCMFQNNCAIDKNTRRFCPSCRLKKCFDIGMRADLILDEEERRLRQEKKAQRIKRQVTSSSTTPDEPFDAQVGSSGAYTAQSVEPDSGFSPGSATSALSFSSDSQTPVSGALQSPLPSFHTLREHVTQSAPPSVQTYSQTTSYSLSPAPPLPHTTSESSPFSALLSQLSVSTASPLTSVPTPQPPVTSSGGQVAADVTPVLSPQVTPCASPLDLQHHQMKREATDMESCHYPLPGPAARLFRHVPRDQLPSDPFMYWIVSAEERLVHAHLTTAYQDVLLSLPERGICRNMPIADTYFLNDFLNEIDDAMYKIVQFSKHITDFRLVRKDDQIAMLKASAMQTLGIACCAVYVHERDCWLSLRGDLTLPHLRRLTNDDPYIQTGVEYCRSVKSLAKNDFTIYALIHCIILFDPRDAKILDRQLINQTRDKYVIMLKHYLESQYSYLYADEYFVAIQDRVREMCQLAQSGNAFYKRYSSAFQPLIAEMLSAT